MGAKKQAIDQTAHYALGVLAGLPSAPYAPWWACALQALVLALAREDVQHRPSEGWSWPIRGWKRWVDVVVTTLGGASVGLWGDFR